MPRQLQPLSEEECLRLLAEDEVKVGRIAVADVRPTIMPVNSELLGDRVVFRSAPGTKLHFAQQASGTASCRSTPRVISGRRLG